MKLRSAWRRRSRRRAGGDGRANEGKDLRAQGAVVTNADIAEARAHKNDIVNRPAITVTFVEGSRKKVGEFSEKNIGKIAAIFIDGKLVAAPVIRAKFSDKAEILGDFGREEAERIAKGINGK